MKSFDDFGIHVKVSSGQTKTICPQCSHTRRHKTEKCLSVNVDKGVFSCKHCGWSGSLDDRVYSYPPLKNNTPTEAITNVFSVRGISLTTILELGITQSYEWMPEIKSKDIESGERLVMNFNYYRNDKLINVKYRCPYKTFRLFKDAELIFYNLDSIKGFKSAIIVEGEMDVAAVHESGVRNVISVPNGATKSMSEEKQLKLEYLDNCIKELSGIEKFILFVDNDEAGISLENELIRRLGREKCWIVKHPDDCKDANDVLLKYGKEAVCKIIDEAQPVPTHGVVDFDEELDNALDLLYENGFNEGHKLGFPKFDSLLRICNDFGLLITATGISHNGKSRFINEIAVRAAARFDWVWGVFSPEHPTYIHAANLMQIYIGKEFANKKNRFRMSELHKIEGKAFVKKHFYFLKDEGEGDKLSYTVDDICSKIIEMVRKHGINGFILDPWNYLEHNFEGFSETIYVSRSLSKILRVARSYGVTIFLVVHPTKMGVDKDGNAIRPRLESASGSGNFLNKTDFGFVTHINPDNGLTGVYVEKAKFRHLGVTGISWFASKPETGQFFEGNIVGEHSELDLKIDRGELPEELRVFKEPLGGFKQPQLPFPQKQEEVKEESKLEFKMPDIVPDISGFESAGGNKETQDWPF